MPTLRRFNTKADHQENTSSYQYFAFLSQQSTTRAELATRLVLLELPNLLALLAHFERTQDPEATIELVVAKKDLLGDLGRPRLGARLCEVREAAAAQLSADWSRARFYTERDRIVEHFKAGRLCDALAGAQCCSTRLALQVNTDT